MNYFLLKQGEITAWVCLWRSPSSIVVRPSPLQYYVNLILLVSCEILFFNKNTNLNLRSWIKIASDLVFLPILGFSKIDWTWIGFEATTYSWPIILILNRPISLYFAHNSLPRICILLCVFLTSTTSNSLPIPGNAPATLSTRLPVIVPLSSALLAYSGIGSSFSSFWVCSHIGNSLAGSCWEIKLNS